MTSKIGNLVQQNSTSTGTGNLTLVAIAGYQSFNSAFGNGATTDVFYYFISDATNSAWEFGTGHMSAAATLVRDTVIGSTNGNLAVNFLGGTLLVVNDIPAAFQTATTDVPTRLYSNTASVGNTNDTSEDTLFTYTLPASTLAAAGDKIHIVVGSRWAANAHTKTLKLYFGSQVLYTATGTNSGYSISTDFYVNKTGSSTQQINGTLTESTTNTLSATGVVAYAYTTAETDTAGIIIKVTGKTGTAAANDVICDQFYVEFLPH